jgi:hypothetical protein
VTNNANEKESPVNGQTVDAGWRSRKLIVGTVLGVLVTLLSSFLMFAAVTGRFLAELPPDAVKVIVAFEPRYWLLGIVAGLVFVGACLGLISLDKLIDLARELVPVLKARFGVTPKDGP